MNVKSEKKRLMARMRRERIKNDPVLYERARERERQRYIQRKREKKLLPMGELPPKVQLEIRTRNRKNYRAYYTRQKEADEMSYAMARKQKVTLKIEKIDVMDPLKVLAAPGHSKNGLRSKYDSTTKSEQSFDHSSTSVQDPPLVSESIIGKPLLQQSSSSTLNLIHDIKKETNSAGQFLAKLETSEDLLPDYEDQYSISDSDLYSESQSESTDFARTTTTAIEDHSDFTGYSEVLTKVKPKLKVTPELELKRYKLKAKKEIDRLHNRIRGLKALVDKYKRQVYRLRKKCP